MATNFTFAEPLSTELLSLAGGLTLTSAVLLWPSIITIIWYRQHDIMRYRNVETLIPFLVFFHAMAILQTFSMAYGKPDYCVPIIVMMALVFLFISHFMLLSPTVVFHSQLNDNKLKETKHPRYFKFARLFVKTPLRLLISAVIGGLYVLYFLLIHFLTVMPGDCLRKSIMTGITYTLGFAIVLAYFSHKLNHIKEPFFLRLEIITIVLLTTPAQMIINMLYSFKPEIFPDWFDYRWTFVLMGFCTTVVNGVFPCCLLNERFRLALGRRVYGNTLNSQQLMKIDDKITKFIANKDVIPVIFGNPTLLQAFKQYASSDWSVENVLFYQDVDNFKKLGITTLTGEAICSLEQAGQIYETYIRGDSLLEVNLPSEIKRDIKRDITEQRFSVDMFDVAQVHIKDLMARDTFVRWRKTPDCKAALTAAFGGSDSCLEQQQQSSNGNSRIMRSTDSADDASASLELRQIGSAVSAGEDSSLTSAATGLPPKVKSSSHSSELKPATTTTSQV